MLRARLLYGRLALRSDKIKGQQSRTVSRGSRSTNQRRSSHIRSSIDRNMFGAAAVALVIIISLSSSAPAQSQSPLPPQYRFRKRYPARRRSAELYVKHSTRNFGLRVQTGSSSANQSERPETRPPYWRRANLPTADTLRYARTDGKRQRRYACALLRATSGSQCVVFERRSRTGEDQDGAADQRPTQPGLGGAGSRVEREREKERVR